MFRTITFLNQSKLAELKNPESISQILIQFKFFSLTYILIYRINIMSREGALWIGGLEPYMDEEFLMAALKSSGENNVISIKVI